MQELSQVPEGYAEVVWISHIDERRMHEPALEPLEELNVIDRAFVVGDSVARAENATGQSGIVTQLHVCLDVEIPGGLRLGNISTRCVQQIRDFIPGFYVLHNGWVGRIQVRASDSEPGLPLISREGRRRLSPSFIGFFLMVAPASANRTLRMT